MKRTLDQSEDRRSAEPARRRDEIDPTAPMKEAARAHSQMQREQLQHRETLILEVLLSSLDAREGAREARSTMLIYLADLLVTRAREELEEIRGRIEGLEGAANGDTPA